MILLLNLPGCYSFSPSGTMRPVDPTDAARVILPGCEDPSAIESVRMPSGREIRFDPWAERDRPFNPLGSQFAGRPLFGVVVVMPIEPPASS